MSSDQYRGGHEVRCLRAPMGEVTVKVTLLGEVRSVTGRRHVDVTLSEGSTLRDLLRFLSLELGEGFARRLLKGDGELHHYVKVFVDEIDVQDLGGLGVKLDCGQVDVMILPMYTGG